MCTGGGRTGEEEKSVVRTKVDQDHRRTNGAIDIGWYAVGKDDAA
jgi:hypothetical protein